MEKRGRKEIYWNYVYWNMIFIIRSFFLVRNNNGKPTNSTKTAHQNRQERKRIKKTFIANPTIKNWNNNMATDRWYSILLMKTTDRLAFKHIKFGRKRKIHRKFSVAHILKQKLLQWSSWRRAVQDLMRFNIIIMSNLHFENGFIIAIKWQWIY